MIYGSGKTVRAVKNVDRKILLVPIMFFFLRIWSVIRFVLYFTRSNATDKLTPTEKMFILLQVTEGNFNPLVRHPHLEYLIKASVLLQ